MDHRLALLALLSLTAAAGPALALTAGPATGLSRGKDTYVPGKAFHPAHTDTCDGDTWVNYKCPDGVARTCTDVRFSHKTGTETDTNTTYKLCSPQCPTDTCDYKPDVGFSCQNLVNNYTCTDVKKMGVLRYKSQWTCNAPLWWWVDVAVTCVK